jgi:hypothetical protein
MELVSSNGGTLGKETLIVLECWAFGNIYILQMDVIEGKKSVVPHSVDR